MAEMEDCAGAVGAMGEAARDRLERAMATVAGAEAIDFADAVTQRDALLAYA